MSSSPKSRKRGRYHHGDLPRALVDAALDLVQEQGVAALTLREVARRVEVTHAAPYRHFKDKSALLAAVAAEGFKRLSRTLSEARLGASKSEQLAATGVAYLRFATHHPAHYRVMFGTESQTARSAALEAAAADVTTELRALCSPGSGSQGSASERPSSESSDLDDTQASEGATTLWAQWHGLALLHLGGWLELAQPATLPKLLAEALDSLPSTPAPIRRGSAAPPPSSAQQVSPQSTATAPLDGPEPPGSDRADSAFEGSEKGETAPGDDFR